MAMVMATLQSDILEVLEKMNEMTSGGDRFMADGIAKAVKDFIDSGTVTSSDDAGSIGPNTYKGAGTGTMSIDEEALADKLFASFTKENTTDLEIASGMADAIDDVCSEENTVTTLSSGSQTTPLGVTTPASGPGQGTFSGTKAPISAAMAAAATTMLTMTSGGNEVFATSLATAINAYLAAGSINITLMAPITGSATGKIA